MNTKSRNRKKIRHLVYAVALVGALAGAVSIIAGVSYEHRDFSVQFKTSWPKSGIDRQAVLPIVLKRLEESKGDILAFEEKMERIRQDGESIPANSQANIEARKAAFAKWQVMWQQRHDMGQQNNYLWGLADDAGLDPSRDLHYPDWERWYKDGGAGFP